MLAEYFFYGDFCLYRRADILDRNHLDCLGPFYTGYAMFQLSSVADEVCAAGVAGAADASPATPEN